MLNIQHPSLGANAKCFSLTRRMPAKNPFLPQAFLPDYDITAPNSAFLYYHSSASLTSTISAAPNSLLITGQLHVTSDYSMAPDRGDAGCVEKQKD
jgi:hypothetical protein